VMGEVMKANSKSDAEIIIEPEEPMLAIFDRELALDQMGGDSQLLDEIAEMFLKDSAEYMQNLLDAAHNGDARDIGRAAHTLKGALGYLGARRAQEAAQILEEMAQTDPENPGLWHAQECVVEAVHELLPLITEFVGLPSSEAIDVDRFALTPVGKVGAR